MQRYKQEMEVYLGKRESEESDAAGNKMPSAEVTQVTEEGVGAPPGKKSKTEDGTDAPDDEKAVAGGVAE